VLGVKIALLTAKCRYNNILYFSYSIYTHIFHCDQLIGLPADDTCEFGPTFGFLCVRFYPFQYHIFYDTYMTSLRCARI